MNKDGKFVLIVKFLVCFKIYSRVILVLFDFIFFVFCANKMLVGAVEIENCFNLDVHFFEPFRLTLSCQEKLSEWKAQKKKGYLSNKAEP